MIEKKSTNFFNTLFANLLLIFVTALCVIPFLVVISASFSEENKLILNGYGIIPRGLTFDAYKVVFANTGQIISAYTVTVMTTAAGAFLSTLVTALAAFPLSRKDYVWRKYLNFFFYFTMIFSGGAISSYLWITQGLHLKNNVLVLILPLAASAWNIFLMRTYMSQIPSELVEAAKIDGSNEYMTFFKIIIPMATVGIATIFVMTALSYWNQWYACLMYLSDDRYTTLQYYLIRVMNNIDSILNAKNTQAASIDISKMPGETARMAMCVVSAGPMIFVFSFFQKYFVGGIAVGSVKG